MGLRDMLRGLRERFEAMPPWVFWAAVAGATVAGVRSVTAAERPILDRDAIRGLPRLRFHTERKLNVAEWLLDEFRREGTLTLDEIAALLTVGYWETNLTPSAVSAQGLPDDAVGRSWGVLQISAETIIGLGYRIEDVLARNTSDAEYERASRVSARCAVAALVKLRPKWASGATYLAALRALHRNDPVALATDLFVRWQGGAGRRWPDVLRAGANPRIGTVGWMAFDVPRRVTRLPDFRAALGLEPMRAEVNAFVAGTAYAERKRWGVVLTE